VVKHALLAQFYSEVQTLRQYALSRLPASSRIRRRKIASVGLGKPPSDQPHTDDELALGALLDSTVVARRHHRDGEAGLEHRWEQYVAFSQKSDESNVTLSDGLKGSMYSQAEVSRNCDSRSRRDSMTYSVTRKDC
jgi:telomerase reverse transcriptase